MKENSEIKLKQKKSFQALLGYKAFHNFEVEVQYKLDQENTFVNNLSTFSTYASTGNNNSRSKAGIFAVVYTGQ